MSGQPAHFEIGARDAKRARDFYGRLFGWTFRTTRGYDAWIDTPGVGGGLHGGDDASDIQIYFSVPDIEAAVKQVRELGGEAEEPGAEGASGRYVSCRDNQGVRFGLHQPVR